MKKIFKFGCLGIISLFVLAAILGIIFGEESSETRKKGSVEVNQSSDEQLENVEGNSDREDEEVDVGEMASIGDELQVGDVAFVVNEVSTTDKISEAGGFITYEPESDGATFLLVNVTVKNLGKEAISTSSSFFKVKSDDVEYSPSTIIATDEKFFIFDNINPGLSKQGNVLFEIPEGLQDLTLNVQTGFWGTEQGLIKIN